MASLRRLLAWAIEHNSHGLYLDTLIFLPEGDRPETEAEWVRLPWLDQPLDTPRLATCGACGSEHEVTSFMQNNLDNQFTARPTKATDSFYCRCQDE